MDLFELNGRVVVNMTDAVKAFNEIQQEGQKTESKLSKFFSGVGKAAAATGKAIAVGIGAGASAMAGLTAKALQLGGELEQNMGGSEAVFGEYADKMQETAKDAFSNMGLSTSDYLATANKMGALFKGAGFETEKALDLSSSAMQRAADVASIMGIDTSAAMEAVAGAAKGNFTMMDNLGVAMNDTTLQAYALEKGIKKSTSEMTNQEKIGLAMEMFMEKTAYAAGNYAKENETLAGSLGTAKSALTNFLDGSGSVEDVVSSVSNLANVVVRSLSEILPRLTTGLQELVQKIVPMIPPLIAQLLPALIDGAYSLLDGLVAVLPMILSTLMDTVIGLLYDITTLITESIMPALVDIMAVLVAALPELIPALIECLVDVVMALMGYLPDIINPLIDNLPAIIIALVDGLMSNLPRLVSGLIDLIIALVAAMPVIIQALIDCLPDVIASIIEGLLLCLPALIEGFIALVQGLVAAQQQIWKSLMDAIPKIFEGIWKGIQNVFAPLGNWFSEKFEAGKKAASEAWSNAKQKFSETWTNIKGAFSNVGSWFSTTFSGAKDKATNAWSNVKSKFTTIKDNIVNAFSSVKDKLAEPFNKARDIIKGVADKIKGFFKGEISFPKIKLPHVSIKPKGWKIGDLFSGVIPSIGIEWYAKAMKNPMLMTDPTVFGYDAATGRAKVGGEAGDEIVGGASTIMNMIRAAVADQNSAVAYYLQKLIDILASYFPQILESMERDVVLDSGAMVGAMVVPMNRALGKLSDRKDRGR